MLRAWLYLIPKSVTEGIQEYHVKPDLSEIGLPGKEILQYAKRIVNLRYELNSLYLIKQNRKIFRPSDETEKYSLDLAINVVRSKKDFKEWIDMMYKYIYESSGGNKAEAILVNFGHDIYKIRWVISKLRNDFFHDKEQFEDHEKHRRQLSGIYQSFIDRKYPVEDDDWLKLQLVIMNRVYEWLSLVLRELKNSQSRSLA